MIRKIDKSKARVKTDPVVNFEYLKDLAPPIIWRAEWDKLASKLGLPYRRVYLQNLDSLGCGPPKVLNGNFIGYPREGLISWLNERAAARN